MPRPLPSTTPTTLHVQVGDFTACDINLHYFREIQTTSLQYRATCVSCLMALGMSEQRAIEQRRSTWTRSFDTDATTQ